MRKVVTIILVVISIVLISSSAYTAYLYFGAYRALRTFNITLKSLDVKVVNATFGRITTIVTYSNPSEYSFHLSQAKQTLYVRQNADWEYFGSQLVNHPTEIPPQSTIDITSTMKITEHMMHLVNENGQNEWYMQLALLISGPMFEAINLVYETVQG